MVTTTAKMITDKQRSFLTSLLAEREVTAPADIDSLTCAQASSLIGLALESPRKAQIPTQTAPQAQTTTKTASVPNGRYALRLDAEVKFYEVNSPTRGNWKGWTFVSALASDTAYPIKNKSHRNDILAKIAEDVTGAFQLYGQEIGCCGMCGRTLTDEESRAFGVGPVCREKL